MRPFIKGLLLLSVLLMAAAAMAQSAYRSHMMVKVMPESKSRLQELYRYTQLDIVGGESAMEPYLVAVPEDLAFLRMHGYRYEIVHQNLEKFYADRLASPVLTMGGYHTYAEIQAAMDSIHNMHPTIATPKWSIGTTLESRSLWVMEITNLSDSAVAKPEVFYNSLTHCREPAAMECMLYFMNWLTDNYGVDPQATYLVDNRKMFFLPCVNPDGYEYNRVTNPGGGGQWRKNRRNNGDGSYGVDLNRNFDAAWGIDNEGSSPIPSDLTYRGPSPFSELETQAFRDFVNAHHFVTEEDFHTYSNLLLIPWGTSYYPPPNGTGVTEDDATFRMIVDSMRTLIHGVNGVWYTAGTAWEVLYNTNGGSFDWSYGDPSHQKVFAMSTEVGGQTDGFWPPSNRILPLAQENLPALIFLARIAGQLAPRPYQVTLNGQCEAEVSGNGNGLVEPSETASFAVTLKNTGTESLLNLAGTVTTSSPYLTVTGPTSWPNLAANESGVNSPLIQCVIASNCPAFHEAHVALHLTANGGLDTTLNLTFVVGSRSLLDNVEAGVGSWTTGGTGSLWHISVRRSQSATHSWFCGNESGDYSNNTNAWLLSDTLALGPGAELSFDQYYNLEDTYDFGYVEMNSGAGWVRLGSVTGNSGAWIQASYPLELTCPGTLVQFRFRTTSDTYTTAEGWYIDNLSTGCAVPPVQAVTPASILAVAPLGGTDTESLHICNQGGCPLTWSVTYTQISPTLIVTSAPPAIAETDVAISKDGQDTDRGREPLDNQGGPDAFGHRWMDSNEPGGPSYNWVEIAGIGTRMNFTTDDQSIAVTLPWNFPFYGTNYASANVSANGNIHFSADTADYGNRSIPSGRLPNAMLALFWDDLSPQVSGGIYYYNDIANNRFIVQYDSVPHYTSVVGRYTCEAILYSTGRIVYQYQDMTGVVNNGTIGIENMTGTDGLQVVYNAAYVTNNLAIDFHNQINWLTLGTPSSGSLDLGACVDVPLNFSAGALPVGTYTGTLTIQSNDGAHSPQNIPVSFMVGQLLVPQSLAMGYDPATSELILTWQATNAPHYKVYSAATVHGPFSTLVTTTTATSIRVPAPESETLYFVVVSSD
jgi:hypothetical protein